MFETLWDNHPTITDDVFRAHLMERKILRTNAQYDWGSVWSAVV